MAENEIGARLALKDRKQFSNDAERAAKDVKKIGDETDKADRKMRTMGDSGGGSGILSKGLGGLMSIAKLGAIAITGLSIAAGFASVKVIKLGMDAAETASAFSTVFGPATAEVQSFVDTINKDFGIPTKELQDAARQFGVFAKAADIPQEGLADFSTSLTQAGLDLASFYNVDTGEALQALQSGLSGETEPLRKYGIFMSEASLDAFAMAEGIGKTTSEMTDQEKVALRQGFILANLGDAQGDLARTSDGLANQWRGLKGRLTEAGTAIGTALLPWVTTLVNSLNDRLAPAVAEMTRTAGMVAPAFKAAFGDGDVTTEAMSLVGIAERLGVAARFIKDGWDLLSDAFKNGGITGVTSELDSLLGTGDLLTGTVEALQSIFSSLGVIWTDLVLPVLVQFNKAIPRGIRPIEMLATGLEWVAENGSWLQPILAGLLAGFIAFKVVKGILGGITAAQTLLNTVMAMNPIGLVVIAIAALAAGLIYAWKNSETFRNVVTGAFNTVKGVVMGVWNWVSENWPLLLAILTGPIGLAVLAITTHWDTIKNGVTGVKDWISEKIDEVVGFFTGLPGRIAEFATNAFDGLKESFRGVVNFIIDGINSIMLPSFEIGGWDIPGPGPNVPSFTTPEIDPFPDIPRLHSGGTTTSAGMVNMKPGEELVFLPPSASVVPMTDTVQSMAASVGGSQKPLVLQVVLDRKVVAEAVYNHTGDRLARS